MGFFKKTKKDIIYEEQIRQKKINMKMVIENAKMVADFFSELTQGCVRADELKDRLEMAKEANPDFFKNNADMIEKEIAKRKIEGMSGLIDIANKTTDDTVKKLKQLKEVGTVDQLENKE